jgi:hypothetical protein
MLRARAQYAVNSLLESIGNMMKDHLNVVSSYALSDPLVFINYLPTYIGICAYLNGVFQIQTWPLLFLDIAVSRVIRDDGFK